MLADVSQTLREEERAAWQRLIRVLGHEINNSLAPIQSIADSLLTLVDRPAEQRADDWLDDTREGLSVIAGRAVALGRFMEAYSRLARLPAPTRQPQNLGPLVRRAAALETRLAVEVRAEPDTTADIDGDQIEQALINLLHNAVDAALETGGGVRAGWTAWTARRSASRWTTRDSGWTAPPTFSCRFSRRKRTAAASVWCSAVRSPKPTAAR